MRLSYSRDLCRLELNKRRRSRERSPPGGEFGLSCLHRSHLSCESQQIFLKLQRSTHFLNLLGDPFQLLDVCTSSLVDKLGLNPGFLSSPRLISTPIALMMYVTNQEDIKICTFDPHFPQIVPRIQLRRKF